MANIINIKFNQFVYKIYFKKKIMKLTVFN